MTEPGAKPWGTIWLADMLRLAVDLVFVGISLTTGGLVFVGMWGMEELWIRVLAFPAAYVALVVGFLFGVILARVFLVRSIEPGEFELSRRKAVPWIAADSFMHMYRRHPLHRYIDDFAPIRYVFYRMMGAVVDRTFFFGPGTRILDPWLTEIGKNVMIGSYVTITAHAVEADTVTLAPVKVGDGALIGGEATLLPGVQVGECAVVAAGALVPKGTRIPPGEVWGGVPAKKIHEAEHAELGRDVMSAES